MTKGAYRRKHLNGGLLIFSEGHSTIVMVGNEGTGRQAWDWAIR